ncbi:MAG: RDD family protein [Sulfurospirillum sp.]|nr:RDD family protein [Sulfurospirillum sp.]MBL0703604.1 RDD family protein [Sulfurospirillum sp.]
MARWRNIKQGKTPRKNIENSNFTISYPINRIKAFITDTFMILMPLLYIVFYLVMGSREEFSEEMLTGWIYIFVPHFCIVLSFWFFKSQTPGYKAYSIKLVSSDLSRPSIFQLIVRYFAFILSTSLIVGLFLALLRKDKKTLHDLISGTMLIQIKD